MMLSSTPASLIPAMARTRLRQCVPTHTRISAIKQQPHHQLAKCAFNEKRSFSRSSKLGYPRKDSQDRESMNTDATEYSKSATDDETAREDNASFDPKLTDPEAQKTEAGKANGSKTNPLEVSPANQEVSKQREPTEGGAENSRSSSGITSDKRQSSGGSSPSKGRKVA